MSVLANTGNSGLSGMVQTGGGCSATINRSRLFTAANSEGFEYATYDAELIPGDQDWWYAVWAYPDSVAAAARIVVSDDGAGSNRNFIMTVNAAVPKKWDWLVFATDETLVDLVHTVSVADAAWSLLYFGFDSVNNTIFLGVNGATPETAAFTLVPAQDNFAASLAEPFMVGAYKNPTPTIENPWNGRMQQLLHGFGAGSLLSAAEQTELYAAGSGGEYRNLSAGLVAKVTHSWPANEESGNLIAAVGGIDLTDLNTVTSTTGHFLSCA